MTAKTVYIKIVSIRISNETLLINISAENNPQKKLPVYICLASKSFHARSVLISIVWGGEIDRMHKLRPTKYSFAFVLIRPTSLFLKEHFFCILSVPTRIVSLISTKTK